MVRGVGAMMNRTRFKRFTFQPVVNPIYNIFLQFYHHNSRLAKAFPVQSVEFIREKGKISFRKYFSIGWQLTGLVQGGEKEPRLEENRKSREPSYRLRSKPQERARGTREAVTSRGLRRRKRRKKEAVEAGVKPSGEPRSLSICP